MKDTELVTALRQLKVNTKSLACLGCGYENKCSTKGCRLIGIAADTIDNYENTVDAVIKMYYASNSAEKTVLRDVMSLFHIYCAPPDLPSMIYDFEICSKKVDLVAALGSINRNQWELITVTYGPVGYTLFFRRPARE
ncbi:MAG: hypothetical protein MSS60_00170 [Clostridiales bacterium]|nr:hypothetical protein [Clostridiales bacterium]